MGLSKPCVNSVNSEPYMKRNITISSKYYESLNACTMKINGSYESPYYIDSGFRITELDAYTGDYDNATYSDHSILEEPLITYLQGDWDYSA
jgi:hypothetical protein